LYIHFWVYPILRKNAEMVNLLNVYDVNEEIEDEKACGYEHSFRMEENRLQKACLNYKPGYRRTGRSKTR
jgi:hypothetical protein